MMKIFVFLMTLFFLQESFGQDGPIPNWDNVRGDAARDIRNLGRSLSEKFTPEGAWIPGFVPIEARIGVMFMSALTDVITALYQTVVPFLNALIITLLMFWFFMETWARMKSGDAKWLDFGVGAAKKMVVVWFWMWIMNNNPAEIFMWIMGPLITVGYMLSDWILNSTANILGTNLPDTCGAIHQWLAGREDLIIKGSHAADLICLPTRPLWFLYTTVWAGFTWILQGLAFPANPLMVVMGLVFVVLFAYNIFVFALRALGVMMDLFFILMFLPFTAVNEAMKGDLQYKGFGAKIWEKFRGFVKGADLEAQIRRFVNVVIYFVILSIIASIAIALLSTVNPFDGSRFFTVLVVGCLVAYLLSKSIEKLNADIKVDESFSNDLVKQIKGAGDGVAKWGKGVYKAIKGGGTP